MSSENNFIKEEVPENDNNEQIVTNYKVKKKLTKKKKKMIIWGSIVVGIILLSIIIPVSSDLPSDVTDETMSDLPSDVTDETMSDEEVFAEEHSLEIVQVGNLFTILDAIDINYKNIESFVNNINSYSFAYEGYSFTVKLNEKNINEVKSGGVILYEDNKIIYKLTDLTIDPYKKITLKDVAEAKVKAILKAPSTAKFPGTWLSPYTDWTISRKKDKFYIASYVDAQNSFGVLIRTDFSMVVTWTEEEADPIITDRKSVV